jgi:FixJ family two-component response regulator
MRPWSHEDLEGTNMRELGERTLVPGNKITRGQGDPTGHGAMHTNQRLIAIVDDDESVREATKDLMRSMGLAVEAFACGEDFLRSPHLSRTACLVADINMPGMSGLDLHRHLSARNKSIPTILVTAYPNDSVRVRALSAGVICYLEKPFSEDDLINGIRSAFADAGDSGNAS